MRWRFAPTYQVAATTCLSLASVRRCALIDRPIAHHGVASTETMLLREVAMSKRGFIRRKRARGLKEADMLIPIGVVLRTGDSITSRPAVWACITTGSTKEPVPWSSRHALQPRDRTGDALVLRLALREGSTSLRRHRGRQARARRRRIHRLRARL